jgi:putative membrane protein
VQRFEQQQHRRRLARRGLTASQALLLLAAAPLAAHGPEDAAPALAEAWTLDPWLWLPLVAFVLLHAIGLRRLARRRQFGSAVPVAAAAGWVGLLLALLWPFDALGEWSLAAHMTQHMLLMAAVPPLLLAGRAPAALLAALPARWRRASGPGLRRLHAAPGRMLLLATLLQAAVMLGWHWPPWMQAALGSDPLHYLMHASFLVAGLWFWWELRQSLRDPQIGYGSGATAVLATMMPMGLLGALLTFSPRVLYPYYLERSPQLGLAPLADQQLSGLIMWVPATLPYLLGGLWLLQAWLRRGERRGSRWPGTDPGMR